MFKFAIVTAIFAFLYAYRHLTPKFIDDHHDTTYYHAIDLSSSGTKLRNSLYKLIRRHRVLTYKEVWEAMEDIDRGNCSRGQVFDIYSGLQSQIAAEQVERNRKGIASTANMHGRSHGAIFDTSPGTNGSV